MSEPIEKIGEVGIGSDYYAGQVYGFKFWKIRRANLSDDIVSNRASIRGFSVEDIHVHGHHINKDVNKLIRND